MNSRKGFFSATSFPVAPACLLFFFLNKGTVNQGQKFQYTSETLLLLFLMPIDRTLPTGVLSEQYTQGKRRQSPLFNIVAG
jgi:hypothetical protein